MAVRIPSNPTSWSKRGPTWACMRALAQCLATALFLAGCHAPDNGDGEGLAQKSPVPEIDRAPKRGGEDGGGAEGAPDVEPPMRRFAFPGMVHVYTISGDGRLARIEIRDVSIRPRIPRPVIELATGKTANGVGVPGDDDRAIFLPDGRRVLVGLDANRTVRPGEAGVVRWVIRELETGKTVPLERVEGAITGPRFSSDGEYVVSQARQTWDAATGKLLPQFDSKKHPGDGMNYYLSVDGYLVSHGGRALGDRDTKTDYKRLWQVHLWDFTRGRYVGQAGRDSYSMEPGSKNSKPTKMTEPKSKLHEVGAIGDGCFAVRVSPSGIPMIFTRLPWGALEAIPHKRDKPARDAKGVESYFYPAILVRDRATGQQLHRFAVDHLDPRSGIIAADNSTLVAVAPIEEKEGEAQRGRPWVGKTELLVWDISAIRQYAARELPDLPVGDWNAQFKKMGDAVPLTAFMAMRRLAASPNQTLGILKQRLQPVAIEKVDYAKLIAQLDGNFAERAKAQAALIAASDDALPYLEKALKTNLPIEARRRIEAIVNEIMDSAYPDAGTRRLLWTIEMLEFLSREPPNSKQLAEKQIRGQVRQLLERLSEGTATAWVTLEARATLARLKK